MYVATGRDLAVLVKPPRVLFVNAPMGNNFGAVGDSAMQTSVLRAALSMIDSTEQGGGLVDYPITWLDNFQFAPGGKASSATANSTTANSATDGAARLGESR